MIVNYLVTGIRYTCSDDERLEVLEYLKRDMPQVILVRENTHDFGVVVSVTESTPHGLVPRGMVSRLDVESVLQLMSLTGYGSLMARVRSVSTDGSYFTIDVEAPEDFSLSDDYIRERWDCWEWTAAPLMDYGSDVRMIEACVKVLDMALHQPGTMGDATILQYLEQLTQAVRFDVSVETQQALNNLRVLLAQYPSEIVNDYVDNLVCTINDMGSGDRTQAFAGEYLPRLFDSDEADRMLNKWYSTFMRVAWNNDEEQERIQRTMFDTVEQVLHALPGDLYYELGNLSLLMHRLLYMDIPRRKLQMLLSAIVLREHLISELEGEYADREMLQQEDNVIRDGGIKMSKNRRMTVEELDRLIERGDWQGGWNAEKVIRLVHGALGIDEGGVVSGDDSSKVWLLFEQGRGDRMRITWQNMAGYFSTLGMLPHKGSPSLNVDFFGDRNGYPNIDKGKAPVEDMPTAFREAVPVLKRWHDKLAG